MYDYVVIYKGSAAVIRFSETRLQVVVSVFHCPGCLRGLPCTLGIMIAASVSCNGIKEGKKRKSSLSAKMAIVTIDGRSSQEHVCSNIQLSTQLDTHPNLCRYIVPYMTLSLPRYDSSSN